MAMTMGGGFSQLHVWQIPCSKIPLRSSPLFSKGLYLVPGTTYHRSLCLCREVQSATHQLVQNKPKENIESVGAFQKLLMVMPSVDILYSTLRKAKRVSPTTAE